MANITVGIQEAVVISNAVVNDKNSLVITLTQGQQMDEFEAMSKGVVASVDSCNMMFFPQDNKWYGAEATHEQMNMKFKQLTTRFAEALKFQVADIQWNLFEGLGFTSAEDVKNNITKLDVAQKIGLNIYKQFVAMVDSSTKTPCRMKLVRQSANKHFPTLPDFLFFKKDGDTWTVPFTESMDIPVAQSKLKYSKKEIEAGKDIATPMVADTMPSGDTDTTLPF